MSTLALKGPYWSTVRQHRRTLRLAGVAVVVAVVVIGGLRLWDAQTPDRYVQDGYWLPANENTGYGSLRLAMGYFSIGMTLLPLLVGVLVAGPMVAREFESGTYRLALTQSVHPARWLRSKLVTAGAVALATALLLTAVYAFGWSRVGGSVQLHWADRGSYETLGTVLSAYVLLALAVGALVGLLIRRTVVAMAVTAVITGTVLFVLGAVRWDFLPVTTITGPAVENASILTMPEDGLIMGQGLIGVSGRRLPGWFCAPEPTPEGSCRPDEPVAAQYLDYHPASHLLPTQLIETGIVLALASLAALVAFRVLRARHP
ncbi:ABC transporter permease [Streptomyces sp. NPDC012756]|uniref:ABC transporter permease n=1 Tax=Streptomyces sp. NPDC012756 TaxID=3364847 RepID=UPI0036C11DD4